MQVMDVDGRKVMLNEREMKYWVDTGDFKRITEGDAEDAEYTKLRDKMIADGNERLYNHVRAPDHETPPMLLGVRR